MLVLQICVTPFILLGRFSYTLGKIDCILPYPEDQSVPGAVFFYGVVVMPIALIPTVIMTPIVVIYRVYVLLSMLARHFICCCC